MFWLAGWNQPDCRRLCRINIRYTRFDAFPRDKKNIRRQCKSVTHRSSNSGIWESSRLPLIFTFTISSGTIANSILISGRVTSLSPLYQKKKKEAEEDMTSTIIPTLSAVLQIVFCKLNLHFFISIKIITKRH